MWSRRAEIRRLTVVAWGVLAVVWPTTLLALEIDVRGVVSPPPDLLAEALEDDEEVLRYSTPAASDERLAEAVVRRARLALQREGYAAPEIAASVEDRDGTRHVNLNVAAGPRLMAGPLAVDGLSEELAARLRERLITPQPPASATPRIVDAGNAHTLEWVNDQGRPVRLAEPLWVAGEPAALDAPYLERVQRQVVRFLRDEGYLHAADQLKRDHRQEDCTIAVVPPEDSGAEQATLRVSFLSRPQVSRLQGLTVRGTDAVTADTLREFLHITDAQRVTEADRRLWEERLRQSGRFIRQTVSLQTGNDTAGGVTAVFDLLAYPGVTPLGEPLTREETAMLRFRSWLTEALAGDGIRASWRRGDGEAGGSCLLSADHGAVVLLDSLDASGVAELQSAAVAFSEAGVGLYLGQEAGHFEVPLTALGQAVVQVALSVRDQVDEESGHYQHDLSLGASVGSATSDTDPAAVVTARIEPVACVALVHRKGEVDGASQGLHWDGDVLEIARDGGVARFDSLSGRLLELRVPNLGQITLTEIASWEDEFRLLRERSGVNRYEPQRPVSSAIAFSSSPQMHAAVGHAVTLLGMERSEPSEKDSWSALGVAVNDAAADGGFTEVDALLAAFLSDDAPAVEKPTIPTVSDGDEAGDPLMRALAKLSGKAWGWLDKTCGRDAWPTGLARLGNAVLRQDGGAMFQEVTMYMGSEETGPLAHLVAASVIPMKPVAASFAMRGQSRLNSQAFRADCQPLLAILAGTGCDQAVVATLRRLPVETSHELGGVLWGNPAGFAAFVTRLQAAATDQDALADVPEGLVAWWEASLGSTVSLALEQRGGGAIANRPGDEAPLRR